MAHLLIIRFSALGDVAMTIPAVRSLAVQYPELKITVLTRKSWEPLFSSGLPGNVSVTGADLSGKHKTFKGLQALYKQLKAMDIDAIADFHGILRSVYLSIRFRMAGIAVSTIDKGRSGKRKLVRKKHKKFKPQKSSFERYADVLAKLGYPVELDFTSIYDEGKGDISQIVSITGEKTGQSGLVLHRLQNMSQNLPHRTSGAGSSIFCRPERYQSVSLRWREKGAGNIRFLDS